MLKRVYIDNYLCFDKFECTIGQVQLLMGANGSGKSSFLRALLALRLFVNGLSSTEAFPAASRTAWREENTQTFELEVHIDGVNLRYRLVVEFPIGGTFGAKIRTEGLYVGQAALVETKDKRAMLYNDQFDPVDSFPVSTETTVFSVLTEVAHTSLIAKFANWISRLFCFKINPFTIAGTSSAERSDLMPDMSNFASGYRFFLQINPGRYASLEASLRDTLIGFQSLQLGKVSDQARLLFAQFDAPQGTVPFEQLSDGQRCLIVLYFVVHFLIAAGCTVLLDEPDNFLSLREVQPLMLNLRDAADDYSGQAIIISHHPEILNELAHDALHFYRDGVGPTHVKAFLENYEGLLTPAEVVARGWEHE